jgi:hypothetical protein
VIRFAEIAVGQGGGVRCSRCHGTDPDVTYRDTDEVRAEISAVCSLWDVAPGPNIVLTGAEPFGHPALPSLVAAAVEARCRRVCLDTDAVACGSAQNAGGSLMAGVRHLRWTLLAGTPGIHDALVGRPGALDASVAGVGTFRSIAGGEGFDVSVIAVVPVCRHNAHDLPAAVSVAVQAGADAVRLRVEDGGMDLASVVPWVIAACDTGVVNGVWVEVEGVPFCLLPGYDLHVADAVRERPGTKQPVCASCALDGLCAGAPVSASADQLSLLAPPDFAAALASGVARSRGEGVR